MKTFLCCLVALFLVSSHTSSQIRSGGRARQLALGGYNPYVIDDPISVYENPARQVAFRNFGWFNIGGGLISGTGEGPETVWVDSDYRYVIPPGQVNGYGAQDAGISFAVGAEWNAGVILSYNPSSMKGVPEMSRRIALRQVITPIPIENVLEVITSTTRGRIDIGLGLLYGWSGADGSSRYETITNTPFATTTTIDEYTEEYSSHLFGMRGGIIYNMANGGRLEGSLALRFAGSDDRKGRTPPDTSMPIYYRDGGAYATTGREYSLQLRGIVPINASLALVPIAGLSGFSGEPEENASINFRMGERPVSRSFSASRTSLLLGLGAEYRTGRWLVAGGAQYSYERSSMDADSSSLSPTRSGRYSEESRYVSHYLPRINLGVEFSVNEWLAARAGYFRAVGSSSYEWKYRYEVTTTSGGITRTDITVHRRKEENSTAGSLFSPNEMPYVLTDALITLGIGIRYEGFSLDATVSEEALRRGLGLIGGQDGINTFGYMTLSYDLGLE